MQKQEHGDRSLSDSHGARHELDALGRAFQGLHNYLKWLLARRGDIAAIDGLWHEHRVAPFPKHLRGKDISGIHSVMLGADVAGCVITFLERGTLSVRQVALLGLAYRNSSDVVPVLNEDAAAHLWRLERLAQLVLRESHATRNC